MTATTRRAAWLASLPQIYCAVCRLEKRTPLGFANQVHHLCSRNAKRPDLYERPANWLGVCGDHHRDYHDGKISHATMALAKLLANPDEFDLAYLVERRPEKFAELWPRMRARA